MHPWQLELTEPESSGLTDDVLSVRQDRGGQLVRFARFTVRIDSGESVDPGARVGLRVAPGDVRLLALEPSAN